MIKGPGDLGAGGSPPHGRLAAGLRGRAAFARRLAAAAPRSARVALSASASRSPRNAPPDAAGGPALRIAEVAVGAARAVARIVPARVKKRVEDGIFHYIFQKTRVENDAYGWRPTTPGGGEPPPGARTPGERAPADDEVARAGGPDVPQVSRER